mgnify:FL=1|tara:strand:+ start:317 stop:520 length:204 start_codon:yes stop_codon:yes gene_type:complete
MTKSILIFNGAVATDYSNNSLVHTLIEKNFKTKMDLVNAFQKIGINLDPTKRISVEDGEMSQYHYFK